MKEKIVLFFIALCISIVCEEILITGKVIDAQDSSIAGVKVRLLKNGDTTTTDANGNFSIIGITGIISGYTPHHAIPNASYIPSTGILSFSVRTDLQSVVFDIFSINGRRISSFTEIFSRGVHRIKPFSRIASELSSSLYFIRLSAGNDAWIFKDYILNSSGSLSPPLSSPQPSRQNESAVKDTLEFSQNGYQTWKLPLENYIADLETIKLSGIPSCEITAPLNGTTFEFGDTFTIAVNAKDNDGTIMSVSLYIDNELLCAEAQASYSYIWNTLYNTIGDRVITAHAVDNDGMATMVTVTISVTTDTAKVFDYTVINTFTHDTGGYTQGLVYQDGFFYEGTGSYGSSTLRKVEVETGKVLQTISLSEDYFGEGVAIWKDTIIQLTWKENKAFLYDKETFGLLGEFPYLTDGWGITHDNKKLIMSDGSTNLYLRDPVTYEQIDSIHVKVNGNNLPKLNELEFFYNKVFANVYNTDKIVMIDIPSGTVIGKIICTDLLDSVSSIGAGVLNGIAYDETNDRIFLTGKDWPKMFEVTFKRRD